MSADNYILVRKRDDGRFGVSMRFASVYYRDEIDVEWDKRPRSQAQYTGTGPVDEFGFAPIPDDWIADAPDDHLVFDTTTDAILAAHKWEREEYIVEYGVTLGAGVGE